MLNAQDIDNILSSLAEFAVDQRLHMNMFVYGGAALVLQTNFRPSTSDLDAFFDAQSEAVMGEMHQNLSARNIPVLIDEPTHTVGEPLGVHISSGHFHTGELKFFNPYASYLSTDGTGLSVWLAKPEHILATKLGWPERRKDRPDCVRNERWKVSPAWENSSTFSSVLNSGNSDGELSERGKLPAVVRPTLKRNLIAISSTGLAPAR